MVPRRLTLSWREGVPVGFCCAGSGRYRAGPGWGAQGWRVEREGGGGKGGRVKYILTHINSIFHAFSS